MEDDAPVIYGLEFQARALTAQTAETDEIRFLVGTQSLKFENQVHQIDFDDENNMINKNVFLHKEGEIWHISASSTDKNIFATCYNKTSDAKAEMEAALWRIPEFDASLGEDSSPTHKELELLCKLDTTDYGEMKGILWHPSGEGNTILSIVDSHILMWDLETSSSRATLSSSIALEGKGQPKFTSGRWNPHHNCSQIATSNDTSIRGWDLRSNKQVYTIENAHSQLVRELDFNPNKQYYLATCGDDCKTKFWDIRNSNEPLKVLSDHSHWVWSVRYNHFHDQLVLTSSSDSRVVLTNAISISSEPYGHLVEDEDLSDGEEDDKTKEKMEDGTISTYEEHEDSVYAAEWSTADPWVFASLSYDGRLVINRVPRAVKYKILL
ncbi:EARP-interacting protein homolog [Lingula anatina]|uniref:EARP-interacting protein homolog n=1 Tax=Lingula anatina TaxID=7574 RepID=A0A1S3IKX8_LINAN|nr:EARP-interacting protein homolog [Lingula anatina]XP_013398174.1 EARP-interacting protein homolog [Lingula anatina]|eukprot:XP_013387812.1 EARP-interacting protein homolog [Lingula anatina]